MSNRIDMPLDEIVELNKQQNKGKGRRRRGRGRSRGKGRAPGAKTPSYLRPRSSYSLEKSYKSSQSDLAQKRERLLEDAVGSALGIESGSSLQVSNLDYGVSDEDIKELFSELGELKHCGVHYDRSGRSNGTAYVVYARQQDALAAMTKYNNVLLDGKPMKIELAKPVQAVQSQTTTGRVRSSQKRAGERASGSQGLRIHGRTQAKKAATQRKMLTADELDADLDKYHKDAMETS